MKLDWKTLSGERDKCFNGLPLVINFFIENFGYKRYLEIGLRDRVTWNYINCEQKISIDIDPKWNADYIMSSDFFFETQSMTFDIIFVDGLHEKYQVKKDILNSIKILNPGGTIICHDVNPLKEFLLAERYCCNAWETFVELRMTQPNLFMFVLPFDYVGGIRRGKQELYKDDKLEYSWEYLDKNRKELLNELTEEEFISIFGE